MAAARPTCVQTNNGLRPGMTHRSATTQMGEKVHFHLRRDTMKAQSGFTLVELMVVVGIIGIIMAIVSLSFTQWNDKYTVESYTKEIHSILMRARNDATTTNTSRLVTLSANAVQVWQDVNNNGIVDIGVDTTTGPRPYPRFTLNSNVGGNPPVPIILPVTIIFDRRGMTNNIQTLRITGYSPNASPGVDCIAVAVTRINMGSWDPTQPVAALQCVQQ